VYKNGPGAFYIEGLKELVEKDSCFVKQEGDPDKGKKGCLEYTCQVNLGVGEEYLRYLDKAILEAEKLGDMELNNTVVSDPMFANLLEE
ncbi:MAG: hypothetical protein F7B59_03310, partial [Desulfurococcales archaeon]|nr:hypothetical protein [Desulfurococcales archaeon]